MIFGVTRLRDAWLIDIEPREDERGFFARTWCRQELAAHGLDTEIAQESLSFNRHCGTELTAENWRALYIPKGFAHGFQTMTDDAEIAYRFSAFYAPEAAGGTARRRGVRHRLAASRHRDRRARPRLACWPAFKR